MAVQDVLPKDRLSSLPNDILIDILSRNPVQLAIVASTLSWRWRSLWKNLPSIQITDRKFRDLSDFYAAVFEITMQIMSPVVQSFSVENRNRLDVSNQSSLTPLDPWLRQICSRNVCQLKLALAQYQDAPTLPKFVLETQSLVSLELSPRFDLQFPDQINLPNLKTLSLVLFHKDYKWLEKLTLGCPSLEELSLNCDIWTSSKCHIKCSNQNLRRLKLNMGSGEYKKVIVNAPKLDYLSVCTWNTTALWYGERPIVLREVKTDVTRFNDHPSVQRNNLRLNLYREIREAEIRTFENVFALDNKTTIFRNVSRLTIRLKMSQNLYVLSFLEVCPVLDFLTLRFEDFCNENGPSILQPADLSNSVWRALKRINIETRWHCYCKPARLFLVIGVLVEKHHKFGEIQI